MPIPLNVPFREKDDAKALGARWNPQAKYWEIPDGLPCDSFRKWFRPDQISFKEPSLPISSNSQSLSLSQLLSQVATTIEKRFTEAEWVRAEVTEVNSKGGHFYLGLAEQNSSGQLVAKAKAIIWKDKADELVDQFEKITGAKLERGIKILVHARIVFHPTHNLSLQILNIDPTYTLGDIAAKIAEIRQRLVSENLIYRQKRLDKPKNFFNILVISPTSAAGLGDFRREANALSDYQICRFEYREARFQGEGAADEISTVLESCLNTSKSSFDAIVIIRGGGAVTDLHWLNNYSLARTICQCLIPVITGIGHERDNTILDEVACIRCDTPSKVIAYIARQIQESSQQACNNFEKISQSCRNLVYNYKLSCEKKHHSIIQKSTEQVSKRRELLNSKLKYLQVQIIEMFRKKSDHIAKYFQKICLGAISDHSRWQKKMGNFYVQISSTVPQRMQQIRQDIVQQYQKIHFEAVGVLKNFNNQCKQNVIMTQKLSATKIQQLKERVESLYRETVAQGPQRTLRRGFIIARNDQNKPIITAKMAVSIDSINLEFCDGIVHASSLKRIK